MNPHERMLGSSSNYSGRIDTSLALTLQAECSKPNQNLNDNKTKNTTKPNTMK